MPPDTPSAAPTAAATNETPADAPADAPAANPADAPADLTAGTPADTPKELSMLLSRVAESIYWAGRYLERAEATARLVKIHTEMYLDLPAAVGIGWSPLLAVTGSGEQFAEQHAVASEDNVIRFLTTDVESSASILSSISAARTNFRVTRAVFPNLAWEELNRLYLWMAQSRAQPVDRRTRLGWLERVIRDCQVLRGLMVSTMSHDAGYSFLEIGRSLECADMTSRVLDVQAGVLLGRPGAVVRATDTYADITWAGVLKSVSAHQMFRRTVHAGISGPEALRFLLRDPQFPKSVEHSLTRISRSLLELPRYDKPMAACAQVQKMLVDANVGELAERGLHEWVDELQVGIAELHFAITATYFTRGVTAPTRPRTEALLATA